MARLHREVPSVLVRDIVHGEHQPGELLPKEVDIAARFDISRGVARECLRALEERDLVVVRHGRGAFVRTPEEWNILDADVLAALLTSDQKTRVLGEYLECRMSLEVAAAGIAADRASDVEVDRISHAYASMEEAAGNDGLDDEAREAEYQRADVAFHQAIVDATGNRAMAHMLRPLDQALYASRRLLARPDARAERGLPEHKRILDAIAARDVDSARLAMADHLATVENYLNEFRRAERRRRR